MTRKIFAVDFDGTFLRDDKKISRADRDALSRLRQRGVITVIATGRSLYSFKKSLAELGEDDPGDPLPIDYVVFSTGAGIMDFPGSNILKKYSLDADDVIIVSKVLDDCNLDYMVHRSVPDTKHFIYRYRSGSNSDFQTRLDLYKEYAAILSPENLADFGEATELLCIVARERGDEVASHLATILSELSVIKATSPLDKQSIWIEIFAREVSKSKALAWLADRVGVLRDHVCAVGNDYNDEDMLSWSGQGYLVANAPDSLKLLYPLVATNNNSGVAEAASRWENSFYEKCEKY